MKELSSNERREWAQMLYTRYDMNTKEVALQTGAPEADVRRWVQEGKWDGLRRSLLTSREEQLKTLYDILAALTARVKQNTEEPNPKDADLIIKYTSAIKNLETDIGVGEIIDVVKPFLVWFMKKDLELAQKLTQHFDAYIKEKLSTF
jgi:hypothetical protein